MLVTSLAVLRLKRLLNWSQIGNEHREESMSVRSVAKLTIGVRSPTTNRTVIEKCAGMLAAQRDCVNAREANHLSWCQSVRARSVAEAELVLSPTTNGVIVEQGAIVGAPCCDRHYSGQTRY